MNEEIDLYNYICENENPLTVFIDPESPYHDYYLKVTETGTFYNSMIQVSDNKLLKLSMSNDEHMSNIFIAYYAGLFELFAEDGIVDTFYSFFPKYCEQVFLDNPGHLFKDIMLDTFLHYASRSFDCTDAIIQLHSMVKTLNNDVKYFGSDKYLVNSDGDTPFDILLE